MTIYISDISLRHTALNLNSGKTSAKLEGLLLQFHFHSHLHNIVLRGPSTQLFPWPTQIAWTREVCLSGTSWLRLNPFDFVTALKTSVESVAILPHFGLLIFNRNSEIPLSKPLSWGVTGADRLGFFTESNKVELRVRDTESVQFQFSWIISKRVCLFHSLNLKSNRYSSSKENTAKDKTRSARTAVNHFCFIGTLFLQKWKPLLLLQYTYGFWAHKSKCRTSKLMSLST